MLLLTLVCLLSLSAVVLMTTNKSTRQSYEARYLEAEYQADLLAESLLSAARSRIVLDKDSLSDTPQDPWAEPLVGEGYVVVIEPCNARLDLNAMADDVRVALAVQNLFNNLRISANSVDYLLDWIDADQVERIPGSELAAYNNLQPPYQPRNGFLASEREILLVLGLEDLDPEWVDNAFTVWGEKKMNINFISRELFEAFLPELGGRFGAVEKWRKSKGFTSKGDLEKALPELKTDQELWKLVTDAISVNSETFRVTVEIKLPFVYEKRRYIVERNPFLVNRLPKVLRSEVLQVIPLDLEVASEDHG